MKYFLIAILFVGCASARTQYPDHWWKEVERDTSASWEILPQEAQDGEVILSKRNELGILSNFAATPFEFEGEQYASLEGFWQMMKYPEGNSDVRHQSGIEWPYSRHDVGQMVGFEAKRAGDRAKSNMKQLGIDWVTYKGKKLQYRGKDQEEFYKLIKAATEAKVAQNPVVREVLLGTGNLQLKPDHKVDAKAPKAWRYYDIYMDIRKELR